jgi:HTH-type transcriptional regulator / antitoxin HipB
MLANDDFLTTTRQSMRIQTSVDLAALIRDCRIALGLNQKTLADKAGVSRQWIIAIEKGKPRAEIALVLRAIDVLGIPLFANETTKEKGRDMLPPVDIDSISAARRN